MQCRMTAILRATVTLAFLAQTRFISRVPHAFRADQRWVRCSSTLVEFVLCPPLLCCSGGPSDAGWLAGNSHDHHGLLMQGCTGSRLSAATESRTTRRRNEGTPADADKEASDRQPRRDLDPYRAHRGGDGNRHGRRL